MRYTNTILQDDWIKNWPELCTHVSSCTTTLTATKAPKRAFYGRLKEMCGYSYNHLKRVQVTFFFRANKLGSCTIMEAAGLPVSVFLFFFFFFECERQFSTQPLSWFGEGGLHITIQRPSASDRNVGCLWIPVHSQWARCMYCVQALPRELQENSITGFIEE